MQGIITNIEKTGKLKDAEAYEKIAECAETAEHPLVMWRRDNFVTRADVAREIISFIDVPLGRALDQIRRLEAGDIDCVGCPVLACVWDAVIDLRGPHLLDAHRAWRRARGMQAW